VAIHVTEEQEAEEAAECQQFSRRQPIVGTSKRAIGYALSAVTTSLPATKPAGNAARRDQPHQMGWADSAAWVAWLAWVAFLPSAKARDLGPPRWQAFPAPQASLRNI